MANVTPGTTFTSTTPITSTLLNLLGQPTVSIGTGEVTAANCSTAGIGYATGGGGTVTQSTSKSTGVTLNKICGQITMNNANLASDTTVSFTLTNSTIAAGDRLILSHDSGGTLGSYLLNGACAAGSATIYVRNITAGALAEAIVVGYSVIKSVTA